MSKAIVRLSYANYVLDTDKAVKLAEILASAEMYADQWRKAEDGGTTYHVYEQDSASELPIRVIPDNLYRMYKLAGKPVEK